MANKFPPQHIYLFFTHFPTCAYRMSNVCNCANDLQAAKARKLPPHLLSLPSARIKYRKQIIFFCLRRDQRTKGWIIFGTRISSSLRWAASRGDVLLITQRATRGKRSHTAVHPLGWVWLQRVKPAKALSNLVSFVVPGHGILIRAIIGWASLVSLINQSCKGGSDEVNVNRKWMSADNICPFWNEWIWDFSCL